MEFNDNNTIKEFIGLLILALENRNEVELREELIGWRDCAFTTSTEYLGELRVILVKIRSIRVLDAGINNDLNGCINAIDKAFEES